MKKIIIPTLVLCLTMIGVISFRKSAAEPVGAVYVKTGDIYTYVTADGVVTAENNLTGENLKIVVSVSETDIYKISEGNSAEIKCSAVPDKTYYGKVTKIYPYARQTLSEKYSATVVDVEIVPEGDTDKIKPGYSAEVEILGDIIENAVTVPYEAVMTYGDNDYVWLAGGDKPQLKEIKLGCENEDDMQVISGLDGGELVILNPPWNMETAENAVISEVSE